MSEATASPDCCFCASHPQRDASTFWNNLVGVVLGSVQVALILAMPGGGAGGAGGAMLATGAAAPSVAASSISAKRSEGSHAVAVASEDEEVVHGAMLRSNSNGGGGAVLTVEGSANGGVGNAHGTHVGGSLVARGTKTIS